MNDDVALSGGSGSAALETVIGGWLHAKFHRSLSEKTRVAYRDSIEQFRASLKLQGLDLDASADEQLATIALTAQAFSTFSRRGKQVSPATINQRLAILSSFYEYAKRQRLVKVNPIDLLERSHVQAYAGAQPLDTDEIAAALRTIDRTTLLGARDYSLLAVLLQTGRRLSEVAALRWQHLSINKSGIVTLTFANAKGGKIMIDALSRATSAALLSWLHLYYGKDLGKLASSAPLWVSLSRATRKGQALGIQAIADVCEKYFGTSKVHATRHTYAHTMEKAGASVSEIQAKLGHESLATTGRYLAALKQAENKHAELIATMLGIE
jgi:integrase/recombinase XerD